ADREKRLGRRLTGAERVKTLARYLIRLSRRLPCDWLLGMAERFDVGDARRRLAAAALKLAAQGNRDGVRELLDGAGNRIYHDGGFHRNTLAEVDRLLLGDLASRLWDAWYREVCGEQRTEGVDDQTGDIGADDATPEGIGRDDDQGEGQSETTLKPS